MSGQDMDGRLEAIQALEEWANAPHATLGLSERQSQVRDLLSVLRSCRDEQGDERTAHEATATKLAETLGALAACRDELAEANETIARIWRALGSPSYDDLAGRSIHDLLGEALVERDDARERLATLENLLRKAREQFAYIEQEAYGDNVAGRTIHACQIADEAIDAALAPSEKETPGG